MRLAGCAVAALLAGAAAGAGTDLAALARDAQRRVFDLELVPPSVDTHPDLGRHGFDRLDAPERDLLGRGTPRFGFRKTRERERQ